MSARTISRLAAVVLGLASATAALVACSSDDSSNNPTPTPNVHDSGVSNPIDSSIPNGGDSGQPQQQDAGGVDSNLPDVGNCTSDASTCNSCYTPQQDPMNGCSPATVHCIKFDNTRVPNGAP